MLPRAPNPVGGIPLMPISPPSHACLRTKPVNRKFTPMVVTARKSERTRSEAKPTANPSRLPAMTARKIARTALPIPTIARAAA